MQGWKAQQGLESPVKNQSLHVGLESPAVTYTCKIQGVVEQAYIQQKPPWRRSTGSTEIPPPPVDKSLVQHISVCFSMFSGLWFLCLSAQAVGTTPRIWERPRTFGQRACRGSRRSPNLDSIMGFWKWVRV